MSAKLKQSEGRKPQNDGNEQKITIQKRSDAIDITQKKDSGSSDASKARAVSRNASNAICYVISCFLKAPTSNTADVLKRMLKINEVHNQKVPATGSSSSSSTEMQPIGKSVTVDEVFAVCCYCFY